MTAASSSSGDGGFAIAPLHTRTRISWQLDSTLQKVPVYDQMWFNLTYDWLDHYVSTVLVFRTNTSSSAAYRHYVEH